MVVRPEGGISTESTFEASAHMPDLTITELEAAINYWRTLSPAAGEALVLCPEASALSEPYALMIVQRQQAIDEMQLSGAAQAAWRGYLAGVGRGAVSATG